MFAQPSCMHQSCTLPVFIQLIVVGGHIHVGVG